MSTVSGTRTVWNRIDAQPRISGGGAVAAAVGGAALALVVAVIHVMDQGGLTVLKDPAYIGYGFFAIELAGLATAALLLARRPLGWLLALGVAAGPLVGYVLTRSTGLPGATEDIGNWTEPIGVASLVSEGLLLVLALVMLRSHRVGR